jgi:hypothetical protein
VDKGLTFTRILNSAAQVIFMKINLGTLVILPSLMPLTYKQYLPGNKTPFLDVANNVAGVGHSHPLVVQASVAEMTNIQVDFFSLP